MPKMHQSIWLRSIWVSFLSALIPVVLLALLCLYTFATATPSGEMDQAQLEQMQSEDGGLRGAAVILTMLPPMYLVLATAFFVVGNLLVLARVRIRGWFVLAASTILLGTPLLIFPRIASTFLADFKGHPGMGLGFVLLLASPIVLAMIYWWYEILRPMRGLPAV